MNVEKVNSSINRRNFGTDVLQGKLPSLDPNDGFLDKHKHKHEENDNENSLSNPASYSEDDESVKRIGLSKKRWVVLFIFSQVTMANAAIWITIPSINNIIRSYYGVSDIVVDWFSMSFLLGYAIFALPASAFMERFGVKSCILTAATLNAAGSCLRYSGIDRSRFVFVAIGQMVAAVGSAFVLQVPPKLAAVWFGEHERATATSIGVLMNLFGVAVGFIQPTSIVEDSVNMEVVHNGIYILLSSQAWFCIATLVLTYIFVDEKPQLPPSKSEALRDETSGVYEHLSVSTSLKMLFRSKDFNLTAQAYGIIFGMLTCMSTLLNQTVKLNYESVSDFKIGMMGFAGTLLGTGATFLVGLLLDRYELYKEVGIALTMSAVLAMVAFSVLLLHFQNFIALFATFCVSQFVMLPFLSSGLAQVAEITYPVSEELSSTIPLILGNFYGFLAVYIFGWLIGNGLVQLAYTIITGLIAVALLLIILAKVPMKRMSAEH